MTEYAKQVKVRTELHAILGKDNEHTIRMRIEEAERFIQEEYSKLEELSM